MPKLVCGRANAYFCLLFPLSIRSLARISSLSLERAHWNWLYGVGNSNAINVNLSTHGRSFRAESCSPMNLEPFCGLKISLDLYSLERNMFMYSTTTTTTTTNGHHVTTVTATSYQRDRLLLL